MGANVWPVDAVSGAPSYTGRLLRQLAGLAWGRNPARPLGANSGVVVGTPSTIATATSTTWTVTPFGGVIDGEASAVAGGYNFSFDSNQTGSVNAADATNPRIDLLYVRISDPAEGDGSSVPVIELLYTAGTPAATPAAPATPARSMALATILVPKSGSGSPAVSFAAPWAVAAGGVLPVGSGVRPSTPYRGQYLDDAAAGLLRWDGSAWQQLGIGGFTDWTAQSVGGSWTAVGPPALAWCKEGRWVHWRGLIAPTSGNFATGSLISLIASGNIPAAARTAYKINVAVSSSTPAQDCRAILDVDGSLSIFTSGTAAPYVDLAGIPPYRTDA